MKEMNNKNKTMTAGEYMSYETKVSQNIEKVRKVKELIRNQKPDLVINRGLGDSIDQFKEWSKDGFNNDYGQSFRYVWDLAFPKGAYLEDRLLELESRMDTLEASKETTPEKVIKTMSGKIITRT